MAMHRVKSTLGIPPAQVLNVQCTIGQCLMSVPRGDSPR